MTAKAKELLGPTAPGTARHTPGPWRIEPVEEHDFRAPIATDHAVVAPNEVCPGIVWAFGREGEANAKLIAAAPALADALAEALRMLREWDTSLGQIEEADAPHLYAALRAAGRQP